MYSLDRKKELS